MRRVLVTGGSGFLGRYVVDALLETGHTVTILDRVKHPSVTTIEGDITSESLRFGNLSFDSVFHIAGLAHVVPHTSADETLLFRVNREGTKNIIRALERSRCLPRRILLVSTVAVYGRESGVDIDESEPCDASDPYGRSKIEAEKVLYDWCEQNGIMMTVVRLPLVAGRNAPGNLGAMVKSIRSRRYLNIGDGSARRSMVLASDAARVFPRLIELGGTFHLTDGHHPSFLELSTGIAEALGANQPRSIPFSVAYTLALGGDVGQTILHRRMPFNRRTLRKMTATLTFSDRKVRESINWNPSRIIDHITELVD